MARQMSQNQQQSSFASFRRRRRQDFRTDAQRNEVNKN
jgi:hypothetical protein